MSPDNVSARHQNFVQLPWEARRELTARAYRLLGYYREICFQDKDGQCDLTMRQLAHALDGGHSMIQKARDELHEKGWITYRREGESRHQDDPGCSFVVVCEGPKWSGNQPLSDLAVPSQAAPPLPKPTDHPEVTLDPILGSHTKPIDPETGSSSIPEQDPYGSQTGISSKESIKQRKEQQIVRVDANPSVFKTHVPSADLYDLPPAEGVAAEIQASTSALIEQDSPLLLLIASVSVKALTKQQKKKIGHDIVSFTDPGDGSEKHFHTPEWHYANDPGFPTYVQTRIDFYVAKANQQKFSPSDIDMLIGDLRNFKRHLYDHLTGEKKAGSQPGWLLWQAEHPMECGRLAAAVRKAPVQVIVSSFVRSEGYVDGTIWTG